MGWHVVKRAGPLFWHTLALWRTHLHLQLCNQIAFASRCLHMLSRLRSQLHPACLPQRQKPAPLLLTRVPRTAVAQLLSAAVSRCPRP